MVEHEFLGGRIVEHCLVFLAVLADALVHENPRGKALFRRREGDLPHDAPAFFEQALRHEPVANFLEVQLFDVRTLGEQSIQATRDFTYGQGRFIDGEVPDLCFRQVELFLARALCTCTRKFVATAGRIRNARSLASSTFRIAPCQACIRLHLV